MIKNFILHLLLILFCLSCEDVSKKQSSDNAVDAFSKIDKVSESNFTKNDRIKTYKKSIARADELKKSLNKKEIYSGYGASSIPRENANTSENNIVNKNSQKKKKTYNTKSFNSQVYSAYSTN